MISKILIAEDDVFISKILAQTLKKKFVIDVATNGEEAMDKIRRNAYAVILLDLIMPEMSGFDVLKGMRKEKIHQPVLVFSNLNQEEEKTRAMKLGAKGYYVKSDISILSVEGIINKFIQHNK